MAVPAPLAPVEGSSDREAAPTVTVAVPVLNGERHLGDCLDCILRQTYPAIVEVLVVDGGSTDATVAVAMRRPGVTVIENPERLQAAGLNRALAQARGEVFVRVDARTRVAPDYVERCVAALRSSGAAMVGGCQRPAGEQAWDRGIAAAMRSPLGAGPAAFRHATAGRWVDTVYLGAFMTAVGRRVGGYDGSKAVNEDAELARRMVPHGRVWLDPSIRSTYRPRATLRALVRQYWGYGRGRADSVMTEPQSLSPRQLVAPGLVLGILLPARRPVLAAYASIVALLALRRFRHDRRSALSYAGAFPAMHLAWGASFLLRVATTALGRRR